MHFVLILVFLVELFFRIFRDDKSLMAMLAGLNTAPVHRLKHHWAQLVHASKEEKDENRNLLYIIFRLNQKNIM